MGLFFSAGEVGVKDCSCCFMETNSDFWMFAGNRFTSLTGVCGLEYRGRAATIDYFSNLAVYAIFVGLID